MLSRVIIACDFNNRNQLETFLAKFSSQQSLFLKIGMELIYAVGFDIIPELQKQGHHIFLDLKLNDIPMTISKALQALKKYQVDFVTIHLTSGQKALELASETVKDTNIKLLGVTVLTSLDNSDVQELFLSHSLTTQRLVQNLAKIASQNSFYGVVCSPWEANIIKKRFPNLKTITPGIQLDSQNIDQKRVASPIQAKKLGSDYLVVGRAITTDNNPEMVYQKILKEFT